MSKIQYQIILQEPEMNSQLDSLEIEIIHQRCVILTEDSSLKIHWQNWLDWYNHHECREYQLVSVTAL